MILELCDGMFHCCLGDDEPHACPTKGARGGTADSHPAIPPHFHCKQPAIAYNIYTCTIYYISTNLPFTIQAYWEANVVRFRDGN